MRGFGCRKVFFFFFFVAVQTNKKKGASSSGQKTHHFEVAAQLVDDERGQGLLLDVLGHDHERVPAADRGLEDA